MDNPRDTSIADHQIPDFVDAYDDDELPLRKRNRERIRAGAPKQSKRSRRSGEHKSSRTERVESRDGTFRCRHCKTIVGPPISGGRHRNHCPLCLYSRHVDRSRPGDRAEECRSMMPAAGVFTRSDGEQMLVHICSGCGAERRNRIAADDNLVALMRLPVAANQILEEEDRGDLAEKTA